ncbi:hypothetical protein VTL71DRAFT_13409 [Oculimacula yallundae]|uniref:Uncharacterized protein n=1 Tax=Oculimacula yallundae TaxID=86028 RepID=A0ABR4CKA1_9HELO
MLSSQNPGGDRGNSWARRRGNKELNLNPPKHPILDFVTTKEKEDVAVQYIADEFEAFGDQEAIMDESNFVEITSSDYIRRKAAPSILRGLLIRGRLQAAVFDIFLQLCLAGVCSLDALQHPVNWNETAKKGSSISWIKQMLGCFAGARQFWPKVQQDWGIKFFLSWHEYNTPLHWLATMIARSFTSLSDVYNIIGRTQQLGPVDSTHAEIMARTLQPNVNWVADINVNRKDTYRGSGTFACWLPENVESSILKGGFEDAAMKLSRDFYPKLEKAEMHYCNFFDIDPKTLDPGGQDKKIC